MSLTVGSLFSGIGGFDLGLKRAGHRVLWQVENDPACQTVLRRRFGSRESVSNAGEGRDDHVGLEAGRHRGRAAHANGEQGSAGAPVLHADVRQVGGHNLAAVDLVVGGFPCQDLSVAGRRAGLAGERSGLWHEFRRVIAELAPRWVLVENVPGLLSSNQGEDFAVILEGLVELGYGVAWRILDAQHFGVPQRRRRVFVVGHRGKPWSAATQVLFEPESCGGDPPTRREAREGVAGTLGGGAGERGWAQDTDRMTFLPEVAHALVSSGGNAKNDTTRMTYLPEVAQDDGSVIAIQDVRGMEKAQNGAGVSDDGVAYTLDQTGAQGILAPLGSGNYGQGNTDEGVPNLIVPSLTASMGQDAGHPGFGGKDERVGTTFDATASVRRLTPTECERLQAFPDGWSEGQSDSTRYRQLGNAVCVNVAEWIGRRFP